MKKLLLLAVIVVGIVCWQVFAPMLPGSTPGKKPPDNTKAAEPAPSLTRDQVRNKSEALFDSYRRERAKRHNIFLQNLNVSANSVLVYSSQVETVQLDFVSRIDAYEAAAIGTPDAGYVQWQRDFSGRIDTFDDSLMAQFVDFVNRHNQPLPPPKPKPKPKPVRVVMRRSSGRT